MHPKGFDVNDEISTKIELSTVHINVRNNIKLKIQL